MRNYLIEDIIDDNISTIENQLKAEGYAGPIDDIYYLPIPESLLTDEQKEHCKDCGPYFLGLEVIHDLSGNALKMELLVRAHNKLRCSCVAYCTQEQRNYMLDLIDTLIQELNITV